MWRVTREQGTRHKGTAYGYMALYVHTKLEHNVQMSIIISTFCSHFKKQACSQIDNLSERQYTLHTALQGGLFLVKRYITFEK